MAALILTCISAELLEAQDAPRRRRATPEELGPAPERLRYKPVPDAEIPRILSSLAQRCRDNFERISTWSATYKCGDTKRIVDDDQHTQARRYGVDPDRPTESFVLRLSTIVSFEYDAETETVLTDFYPKLAHVQHMPSTDIIFTQQVGGPGVPPDEEGYRVNHLKHQISLISPEQFLRFVPERTYGRFDLEPQGSNRKGKAAFRAPPAEGRGKTWQNVVDPRDLFGTGRPMWELLEDAAAQAEKRPEVTADFEKGAVGLKLEHAAAEGGDVYILRVRAAAGENLLNVMCRIDTRVACNATYVSVEPEAAGVEQSWQWEFENVDGIWLPSLAHTSRSLPAEDIGLFSRTLRLETVAVNEPIAVEDPYRRLGLSDGDRVVDLIEGKVFVYAGGELGEPMSGIAPAKGNSAPEGRTWLLAINILALLAIGVVFVLKKRRRPFSSNDA